MENFRNCLSIKRVFTEQIVRISLWNVQNFKDIRKTMPFKVNDIFT